MQKSNLLSLGDAIKKIQLSFDKISSEDVFIQDALGRSLSKPIIFGPSTYNFEEISKQLLDNDASIQVSSADELMQSISELQTNKSRREKLGTNARKTFVDNQGAVNYILASLKPYIENKT